MWEYGSVVNFRFKTLNHFCYWKWRFLNCWYICSYDLLLYLTALGGERSLLGKVSLKFLYEILKMSSDCPLQGRTEIQFSTEFRACNLKVWHLIICGLSMLNVVSLCHIVVIKISIFHCAIVKITVRSVIDVVLKLFIMLQYCLQQYSRTKNRTISIRSSDDSEVEVCSSIDIIYPPSKNTISTQFFNMYWRLLLWFWKGKLKNVQISTRFEEFGAAREPPPCRRRKRNEEASSSSSLPHIDW